MKHLRLAAILLVLPAGSALAQAEDHAPTALSSAARMSHDRGESWTYIKPGLDLAAFRNIMIDPVVVYSGPDAQFEDIDTADRTIVPFVKACVEQAMKWYDPDKIGASRMPER